MKNYEKPFQHLIIIYLKLFSILFYKKGYISILFINKFIFLQIYSIIK